MFNPPSGHHFLLELVLHTPYRTLVAVTCLCMFDPLIRQFFLLSPPAVSSCLTHTPFAWQTCRVFLLVLQETYARPPEYFRSPLELWRVREFRLRCQRVSGAATNALGTLCRAIRAGARLGLRASGSNSQPLMDRLAALGPLRLRPSRSSTVRALERPGSLASSPVRTRRPRSRRLSLKLAVVMMTCYNAVPVGRDATLHFVPSSCQPVATGQLCAKAIYSPPLPRPPRYSDRHTRQRRDRHSPPRLPTSPTQTQPPRHRLAQLR